MIDCLHFQRRNGGSLRVAASLNGGWGVGWEGIPMQKIFKTIDLIFKAFKKLCIS
jgi:hypothetical protein